MVARQRYAEYSELILLECRTFSEVCNKLKTHEAEGAVMAIENSLVGAILPNYSLLEKHSFKIVGENYLHIRQNLMALPGQRLEQIETVISHPMALHQCSDFLEANPQLQVEESHDTADSAKRIRTENLVGWAAIASELAAELYNLNIVKASVENRESNYTRFLGLSRDSLENSECNKASINFRVNHSTGALANVLDIFRDFKVNLSLIQSIPIPEQSNQYAFHVDLEWSDKSDYIDAISKVSELTSKLKILGEYKAGKKPNSRNGLN